jgi:hypothetical protein
MATVTHRFGHLLTVRLTCVRHGAVSPEKALAFDLGFADSCRTSYANSTDRLKNLTENVFFYLLEFFPGDFPLRIAFL